jgi:hypothetical protein
MGLLDGKSKAMSDLEAQQKTASKKIKEVVKEVKEHNEGH